jgi:hypothetical protein
MIFFYLYSIQEKKEIFYFINKNRCEENPNGTLLVVHKVLTLHTDQVPLKITHT